MQKSSLGWLRQLGPGLLFAGMAIGTSHLVQSTRAGAVFGLGLAGVILLANIAKYPAYRFGAAYAAATGETLIAGYRRIGLLPLLFLMAVFVFAHGFAVAAIGVVTAGMFKAVLGVNLPLLGTIAIVLGACALFLALGRYKLLESVNRFFMAVLTLSTLVATVLVLPNVDWSLYPDSAPPFDLTAFLFVVALAGWMPTPIEAPSSQACGRSRASKRVVMRCPRPMRRGTRRWVKRSPISMWAMCGPPCWRFVSCCWARVSCMPPVWCRKTAHRASRLSLWRFIPIRLAHGPRPWWVWRPLP
ncbi:divalent metal cation transporter [Kordiimonas gwangyangensis]|uniref:divalent metal cation transporter n=1 Tax=Kordiimonas gwangyangensis TaxID=288022 RepID=UPI000B113419|nr:divalent metal cation transporter [Kordiimonas gwangyangensis]